MLRDEMAGSRELLSVAIRSEMLADCDAIRNLTVRAFAGHPFSDGSEPRITDALREAGALALSLVALAGERLVGHAAFSPAGPPDLPGWFALGPVSVEPSLQRRGVGSRLVKAGLKELRARGAGGCVLIGDHGYYGRFGFSVMPALAPPDYPAEHFQVLAFGTSLPDCRISFHAAFSADS